MILSWSNDYDQDSFLKRASFLLPLCLMALLSSCADIMDGSTQIVSVQATGATGEISDVQCVLNNKSGSWQMTPPGSVTVHRGSEPLDILCTKDGYAPAAQQVASTTNNDVYDNIVLGGGLGAAVDKMSGAAWKYPKLITVPMQPATVKSDAAN